MLFVGQKPVHLQFECIQHAVRPVVRTVVGRQRPAKMHHSGSIPNCRHHPEHPAKFAERTGGACSDHQSDRQTGAAISAMLLGQTDRGDGEEKRRSGAVQTEADLVEKQSECGFQGRPHLRSRSDDRNWSRRILCADQRPAVRTVQSRQLPWLFESADRALHIRRS